VLNHKGKLRTDLRILRGADWFWLDCEEIGGEVLRHMARTYSLGRDVTYEDVTAERSILALVGPGADALLDVAPPQEEHSFAEGEHGLYVRTALGIDVITADGQAARAALGAPEVDPGAAECLRVERGRPRLGYDMDGDTIPQEAGINERAVSFSKGCYVGQETVARLHYKGKPNRHLRGLRLSEPARRGDEITLGDKAVGRLGSTCESPRHGPIALALVRREAAPGDEVLVAGSPATVVELPFTE
jgi:folate-binding protein YgfZ